MDRPISQVDLAVEGILRLVRERGLRSGDRLDPERELAVRLATSRTVVREALNRLVSEGLLTSRQGSGTYIADVDVAAITEVRLLLEPTAAGRAAQARTGEQARRLGALARELAGAVADRERFSAIDTEVHAVIAAACGNPVLSEQLRRLARTAALSRQVTSGSAALREATVRDVTALAAAVQRGDAAEARRAMRRHLRRLP
jgi:GntR family transcriptional repressor for pyruvate dehydrogenase complex